MLLSGGLIEGKKYQISVIEINRLWMVFGGRINGISNEKPLSLLRLFKNVDIGSTISPTFSCSNDTFDLEKVFLFSFFN